MSPTTAALIALAATSFALAVPGVAQSTAPRTAPAFPVRIDVDLATPIGPFKPVHRFFGCDEPNYAYMPSGSRLLGELGKTSPTAPVYFRTHNLMTTGDGTPHLKWGSTNLYTEDADGKPVYDFTIVDKIFDAYLANGVRPYAQLGFMPKAMSTKPEPYEHHWDPTQKYDAIYTGWAYPPKDYAKWGELCYQWVKHCVERYGREEVEKWYWQTWNEPNIGYWKGTAEEFHKLHDYAVAGVRRALPTARVGGPDTAGPGGEFMRKFVDHCLNGTNYATGEKGTPLDFVSFHAKGMPQSVEGRVRMNVSRQLKNIDDGFKQFAANPRTKGLPIIIGESDPEGCAACQGPDLKYRNGTMYSSYTAASFARKIELADRHGVNFEGALTWAFLFEEQPAFAGFRVLASGAVDHPVMNVFRMFAEMRGDRVAVTSNHAVALDDILANSVRAKPDVAALATRDAGRLAVMLWHYHDDDLTGPDADVSLALAGLPADAASMRYSELRIDRDHGNAFTAWTNMGSPAKPDAAQIAALQAAAKLDPLVTDRAVEVRDGKATIAVRLPRQGVSLIVVEPAKP